MRTTKKEHYCDVIKWLFIVITFILIGFLIFIQRDIRIHDEGNAALLQSKASSVPTSGEEAFGSSEEEDVDNEEFSPVDPYAEIQGYSLENLFKTIYKPNGMFIDQETLPILKLQYLTKPQCGNPFGEYVRAYRKLDLDRVAPDLPKDEAYHMNGRALRLADEKMDLNKYVNGSYKKVDYRKLFDNYRNESIWSSGFGAAAVALQTAFKKNPINDGEVFVFGSDNNKPWVEVLALQHNASKITVSEFLDIQSDQPNVVYKTPIEIAENYKDHLHKYDYAVSFNQLSSLGLGREGEAMDPNGDIKEVLKMACLLKPEGLLFLGELIGRDSLVHNRGRIYGRIRLPMLFAGFELVETFLNGQEEPITLTAEWLDEQFENKAFYPVFVLRKY